MSTTPHTALDPSDPGLVAGSMATRAMLSGLIFGVAGLGIAFFLGQKEQDDLERFMRSYLVGYTFCLSIALGALFFVLLQHLTRAGWSVVVRRIAEAISTCLFPLMFLALPIVINIDTIYPWADPEVIAHDHHLHGKLVWLNSKAFVIRLIVYFAFWTFISAYFYNVSVKQDETGDTSLSRRLGVASAPCMILYAVTSTFAAFDLLMSLDPHWFSTIFGVYFFAGGTMGFAATLILCVFFAQTNGRLVGVVTREHFHDMGKLLFAFTCFWGYIAFSQYMLIWYANLPEETGWFHHRIHGGWGTASVLFLIFGHFLAPFVLIMSRNVKRLRRPLALAAAWQLAMHWFDHYWLVMPGTGSDSPPFSAMDLAMVVGFAGLMIFFTAIKLRGTTHIVPVRDPRLAESLAFENY